MAATFNPPPGWPVPAGWTPPPNWQPDPSWPPAPAGWPFWVDRATAVRAQSSLAAIPAYRWVIGGGAAVVLGSVLPFISNTTNPDYGIATVGGGDRAASALFGLIIVALGLVLQRRQAPAAGQRPPIGLQATLLTLSILGFLGYGIFAFAGEHGFQEQDELGLSYTVTFSPNIGLILAIAGCAVAVLGALPLVRQARAARRQTPLYR